MDIKHFFEKMKSVFTSDKKLAVLCAVGVLGVVLLILSEFIPSGEKKAEKKESVTAAQSQETYAEDIEKRLTELFPPPCSAWSMRQISSICASSGVNFLSALIE